MTNPLFGVLDAEYASKMSNTINAVAGNETYLDTLLKNQTLIIYATINIINKDQKATKIKFKTLEMVVNDFNHRINKRSELVHWDMVNQIFMTLCLQMNLKASNLNRR